MAVITHTRENACTLVVYATFQGREYAATVLVTRKLYELRSYTNRSSRRVTEGCDRFNRVQEAIVATPEVQAWIARKS